LRPRKEQPDYKRPDINDQNFVPEKF